MIKFLVFLLLSFSSLAWAKDLSLKFNEDVFHCGQNYKFLYELEKLSGVYQADGIGLAITETNELDAFTHIEKDLLPLSPARSRFLAEIISTNNPRVQFKKNIQIPRVSLPSNLITPAGCTVEPLSTVEVTKRDYTVIINDDIYSALSIDGKVTFALNLALDIEQAISITQTDFPSDAPNMSLIQGREFIACWFSSKCRPKTYSEMHAIAKSKNFNLPFYEQGGILIPTKAYNTHFDTRDGLIVSASEKFDVWQSFTGAFNSSFTVNQKVFPLPLLYNSKLFVKFDKNGNVICAPTSFSKIFNGTTRIWSKASEDSAGIWPLAFPLCWDEVGNIKQGAILLKKDEPLNLKIGNQTLQFNLHDPLSDGDNYYSGFIFYPNGTINWAISAKGDLSFNDQILAIKGRLKLFPSGKPQCFQVAKAAHIKTPKGQVALNPHEINCFKEDENFEASYNNFEYDRVIEKDLISP
jgi:hypothetical protein